MATDRGLALAQTYLLPQQQQAAPVAPKPFQDEVGAAEEGLQQVDGVTSEYFDKWSALKGFARDAWENYGIDVRYPDPSIPESNNIHRIYLKAIADLKQQGNRLKTGQKMYEADRQRGSMVNNQEGKYYDELNVGTDIVDTKLDPIVDQANNKLQQLYFKEGIDEARAYYTQIKGRLEQLRDTQPNQAGYWQRQLDALTPPTQAHKEFDPNRSNWTPAQRGQIDASGNFLKEMANIANGSADGYKLSTTEHSDDGGRVYEYPGLSGNAFGGGVIKGVYHVPSTGNTYAKVERNGKVEKVELSRKDIMGWAKEIAGANGKYTAAGQYLDLYAQEKGLYGTDNSVSADGGLKRSDYNDVADVNNPKSKRAKELAQESTQEYNQRVQEVDNKLAEMKPGFFKFTDDRNSFTNKKGQAIKIAAREGDDEQTVYEVENVKELYPGLKPNDYARLKKMSRQMLVKWLAKEGVFDVKGKSGTVPAPSKAATAPSGDRKSTL